MKRLIPILLIVFCFFSSAACLAGSYDNSAGPQNGKEQLPAPNGEELPGVRGEYLAEQKVKMLPSNHGKTIEAYLTNMTKIPMAEDLGWKVSPIEDGYEVERSILINKVKTLRYKWKVSNSGEVSPMDDRARKLMK